MNSCRIELYNADCLNKMQEIQNDSIDLILTDPPLFFN